MKLNPDADYPVLITILIQHTRMIPLEKPLFCTFDLSDVKVFTESLLYELDPYLSCPKIYFYPVFNSVIQNDIS